METLQELFKNSGHYVNFDNRNKAVKSINNVLKNSQIKILLVKKGFIRTTKSGYNFNLKITLNNLATRSKINNIKPYDILNILAKFLKREDVSKIVHSVVTTPYSCPKCDGTGFIPQFSHYAQGVCFDCMGIGVVGNLSVKDIRKQEEIEAKKRQEEKEQKEYKRSIVLNQIIWRPIKEDVNSKRVVSILNRFNTKEIKEKLINELAVKRNKMDGWGAWLNVKEMIKVTKEESLLIQNAKCVFEDNFNFNSYYPISSTNDVNIYGQISFNKQDGQEIIIVNFYKKSK
jgi:hypothetical protein